MRRSLGKLLSATLAVALLLFLLYRFRGAILLRGFSWRRLGASLRETQPTFLLLSVIVIYACYALRALRWVRFSRYIGRAIFANVYSATIEGFTSILLLGRLGEPIRPLLIARKDHLPVADSFGVYVLERVMDTSATVVLTIFALLALPKGELRSAEAGALLAAARTAGVILLCSLVIVVAFLIYFRLRGAMALAARLQSLFARGGWRGRLARWLSGFGEGLQCIRSWSDLGVAIGYTAAHWILIAAIYVLVDWSFPGQLRTFGFSAAVIVLTFTMVGSAAQLPAVGGGSQLASFLVFTVVFGVEQEPAAAASIVLWLITFAAVSLAGLPLLIREGWSLAGLWELARAEARAEASGTHVSVGSAGKKQGEMPQ